MMSQDLIDQIIKHEGMCRYAYNDSKGYITIGIGRCVDSRIGHGLDMEEQLYLLNNDLESARKCLSGNVFYDHLDEVRKDVLVEMVFNMGFSHLLQFKEMLKALEEKSFRKAVTAMADSLWAKQIGKQRLNDMSFRLLNGVYPG